MANIIPVSEAGLDAMMESARYTDADILNALRVVADDQNTLTAHDYEAEVARRHGALPNRTTVARRFGTWNAAVEAAGLTPLPQQGKRA